MVYNWEGKEAECYRLYVEEKRSLDDVMKYWEPQGFTPSKRAFQTQFKRWDFPSKQNPAHQNPALTARIKELWEKNYSQKDMVDTLQAEGFQINDRELMRVRLRFKWFLRESRSKKRREGSGDGRAGKTAAKKKKNVKKKVNRGRGLIDQLANSILQGESSDDDESEEEPETQEPAGTKSTPVQDLISQEQPLDPAEVLKRQLRQREMEIESNEKWRTRKRRRRTRGWAGLPADAPGVPPRFPSETTLDEAKAYLGLENKVYKSLRDQFQAMCEEQNVIKKTIAGPEKWAQLLQRLIRESTQLSNVFREEPEALKQNDTFWRPRTYQALSLDVICQDVTKRMRVIGSRMSLAEAKNALGLDPEQTRQARSAFLAILKADHFTNKFMTGDEHWNELRLRWVQQSETLSRAILPAADEADQQHAVRLKAIDILARDVMKRFRAEEARQNSSQKKQTHQGPGPGPAAPSMTANTSQSSRNNRISNGSSSFPRTTSTEILALSAGTDLQIDPSLLLAASDASIIPRPTSPHDLAQPQHQHRQQTAHTFHRPFNSTLPHPSNATYAVPPQISDASFSHGQFFPLPIYFRLHPHSATPVPNKTVWLSVLQSSSLAEVKNLAMREHPGSVVARLEGVLVHRAEGGDREVAVPVEDDDELRAFLGHEAGGKATFVVLLEMGGQAGGYA